jgi:hypothetical protein
MMKERLLIILFVLIASLVSAQAPGYQGKKLTVVYNNYVSPAIIGPNYKGNRGLLAFNSRHSLGVDYVRARKRCIGLAVQLFRTRQQPMGNFAQYLPTNRYNVDNGDTILVGTTQELVSTELDDHFGIINTNISLYWKFYGSKFIAPWGRYHRFDFVLMKYKVKKGSYGNKTILVEDEYYNQSTGNTDYKIRQVTYTPVIDEAVHTGFMFAYSYGKQRVLYDKIVVDYAAQLGLVFSALGADDKVWDYDTSAQANMIKRINRASAFTVTLGIGYLAR